MFVVAPRCFSSFLFHSLSTVYTHFTVLNLNSQAMKEEDEKINFHFKSFCFEFSLFPFSFALALRRSSFQPPLAMDCSWVGESCGALNNEEFLIVSAHYTSEEHERETTLFGQRERERASNEKSCKNKINYWTGQHTLRCSSQAIKCFPVDEFIIFDIVEASSLAPNRVDQLRQENALYIKNIYMLCTLNLCECLRVCTIWGWDERKRRHTELSFRVRHRETNRRWKHTTWWEGYAFVHISTIISFVSALSLSWFISYYFQLNWGRDSNFFSSSERCVDISYDEFFRWF